MNTIQIYSRVSETKVISYTKKVSSAKQKAIFQRYAKTYRLAYGHWPSDHSLSLELKEYGGVNLGTLKNWMAETQNNF